MKLYRKRYIPNEIIDISSDEIIFQNEEKMITRWKPINPREDIGRGESCVYFLEGWKISKFYGKDGSFQFWYCDIIEYQYDEKEDKCVLIDLLLDVIVHEDGSYEVLDEDELEKALQDGIITKEIADRSRKKLANLLKIIEDGNFKDLDF